MYSVTVDPGSKPNEVCSAERQVKVRDKNKVKICDLKLKEFCCVLYTGTL